MTVIDKINNHYNYLINKHGINREGLGWGNDKLNERYDIFFKNINFKNKSILDFGCGFCDLYFYLNKKIKIKDYIGYEINPKIINIINKSKKKINISNKLNYKNQFDIIISNGVHNFNYMQNKRIIRSDLKKMFKISKHYIGISFLNNDVDYKENYLYYHDEKEIVHYIKKNFKCSLKINKSFSKYETFLIIKKA